MITNLKKEKEVKVEIKKSYSFYEKGVEYVIKAKNQTEARQLFNKLIQKSHGKRNSKA